MTEPVRDLRATRPGVPVEVERAVTRGAVEVGGRPVRLRE